MNDDTTRNPDEPDGRVGTGPREAVPGEAISTGPRPYPRGGVDPAAARTERVTAADRVHVDGATEIATPRGEAMPNGAAVPGEDLVWSGEPVPANGDATPPNGSATVNGRSNGAAGEPSGTAGTTVRPRPTPGPRTVADGIDAPTAELRTPVSNGTRADFERSSQHVPSSVPEPGPSADAPPPWHRVPGHEPPERASSPVDDLLDVEGPTAFMAPSTSSADDARGERNDKPSAQPWSSARSTRNRPPRQAALQLKRFDPWSVLKLALVLAVVLFLIWLVAVGILYGVLQGIGVWDRLNGTYADLVSGSAQSGAPLISAGRVFGLAAVVGAINSLLFAVAVTVAAFVYNVSADLVGGIEVTLSERD